MLEAPSTELTKASTEQAGSSTKHWVDNKKAIFTVELLPATTVHALDVYIDRFLSLTAKLQLGKCMKVLNPMSNTFSDLRKLVGFDRKSCFYLRFKCIKLECDECFNLTICFLISLNTSISRFHIPYKQITSTYL